MNKIRGKHVSNGYNSRKGFLCGRAILYHNISYFSIRAVKLRIWGTQPWKFRKLKKTKVYFKSQHWKQIWTFRKFLENLKNWKQKSKFRNNLENVKINAISLSSIQQKKRHVLFSYCFLQTVPFSVYYLIRTFLDLLLNSQVVIWILTKIPILQFWRKFRTKNSSS